mgnify:CR=1 FL=1
MARQYSIRENQSLLYAALITTGSVESVVKLALQNGLSITDKLVSNTPIAKVEVGNQPMFTYYKENKLTPATDATYDELFMQEGIDYWAIEDDFVVQ